MNYAKQRNVSNSHVIHLAQQMSAGQWQENGEPIIFDKHGNVINGQHRLFAVIRSGKSIKFLIVEGVDESAFVTIDSGKPRSSSDILSIQNVPNYTNVASCVAGVMNYRRALKVQRTIKNGDKKWEQIGGSLNSYIRPSKIDIVQEYEKHANAYQKAVKLSQKCRKMANQSAFSIVIAMAVIDGQKGELIDQFIESVSSGIGLFDWMPEYALRQKLEQNRNSLKKLSANHVLLLVAKAWNLYANNCKCKRLALTSEIAFPIE